MGSHVCLQDKYSLFIENTTFLYSILPGSLAAHILCLRAWSDLEFIDCSDSLIGEQ